MSTVRELPPLSLDHNPELSPLEEMFVESQYHKPFDIPVDLINTAHQVRPKEDFGDMKELARSVKELGVEQPIRVARWPLDTARAFVQLNNRAYSDREPLDPDMLVPCPDGVSYLVVIYGHRRLAAAITAGLDVIPSKVSDNPSFHDVLKTQTAENLHNKPKPFTFARGLKQVYELGTELGVYKDKTDFARRSSVSVATTTAALRYCSLPSYVQEMVVNGELNYSKAVEVARLMEAALEHELLQMQIRRETEIDQKIAEGKITPASRERRLRLRKIDTKYLNERVQFVIKEAIDVVGKPKVSLDATEHYVRRRINAEFRGVGTIDSLLMDDNTRRKEMLAKHNKRARKTADAAYASLGNVVLATRLYGEDIPEEIRGMVNESKTQRLLNKVARSAGVIATTARKPETRQLAFDAKMAVDELVSAEAALLADEAADKELEHLLKLDALEGPEVAAPIAAEGPAVEDPNAISMF